MFFLKHGVQGHCTAGWVQNGLVGSQCNYWHHQ